MREVIGVIDLRLVDKDAVTTAYVTRIKAIGSGEHFGMVARYGWIIQHESIARISSKGVTSSYLQRNHPRRAVLPHQHERRRSRQGAQDFFRDDTRDAGMKLCSLDILLAAQWRGVNHNSCIAFTLHVFADIQYWRGDILLVEPVVEIEVFGKQAVGDGSEVDAVVNGAFEG